MSDEPSRLYEIRRKAPRNRDADLVSGAIVKESEDFLLVQSLTRAFEFDGYVMLRRDDVLEIQPYAADDIANVVLRLKHISPSQLDVPVSTAADALAWLRKAGEVCSVEIPEKLDISYVGYVRSVGPDGFEFLHLKTSGERGSTGYYPFRDCDCISFMGGYERSLMLYDADAHGGPPA